MRTKGMALLINALITTSAYAQLNSEDIQQFIVKTDRSVISLQYPENVKEFYKTNHYNSVWINNDFNRQHLLQLLTTASSLGLQEEDYQYDFIQPFRSNSIIPPTRNDSLFAEIRFTDAAIHF